RAWLAVQAPAPRTSSDEVSPVAPVDQVPAARIAAKERARPRRRWASWLAGAVAVLAVIVAAGLFLNAPRPGDAALRKTSVVAEQPSAAATPPAQANDAVPAGSSLPSAPDDPHLGPALWEAPAAGEPLSIGWLPAGAPLIVALRPAELAAHPAGAKLLDALGPWGETLNAQFARLADGTAADVKSVLVGFYDASPDPPMVAWALEATTTWDSTRLTAHWPDVQSRSVAGETLYAVGDDVRLIPARGNKQTLLVCSAEQVKLIPALAGVEPPLRREFKSLLAASDNHRAISVLFAPTFLTRGGKTVWGDELRPLSALVDEFLGRHAAAALLSLQLDDDAFAELRVYGRADLPPRGLAKGLRDRWLAVPSRVAQQLASLVPSDYSRAVLERFPSMVETLVEYTRVGLDDRQAVLRCYLPAEAAANLVWGTRLATLETAGAAAAGTATASTSRPQSIAVVLEQPYELKVPRAPLDKTLAQVALDLNIEIEILGTDLQLEGITKNQSFSLDERGTAGAVLRKILQLANPDGKLLYVIKPGKQGAGEALFVTTRAAAASRGDPLPPEYAKSPDASK
ncbi:MAG: hypothetical protein K1X74_18335, partial [Pirellulales bacterium]|nr:hypothetical protein [Pirellulales bacterium]